MIVDLQQLEKIRYSFTDLGRTLKTLSTDNEDLLKDTLKSLKEGFAPLLEMMSNELLKSMSSVSQIQNSFGNQTQAAQLQNSFFLKSAAGLETAVKITIDIRDMDKFSEMMKKNPFGLNMSFNMKDGKVVGAGVSVKANKKSWLAKDFASVWSKLKGMGSVVHIPTPGNILATILGVMAFGFATKDRIAKEAGEVTNIMVQATDSGVKGMVSKGTSYISGLQEKFQKFYGIAKEETQGVASAFISGGIGIKDMLTKVEMGIKGVKDNYFTFSFAVDKMFEMAGGTTANRMVSMMADYGKTLDQARESTLKLMMAGKDSGIGTQQFAKNVEDAGVILQKYGFDIDDVIDLSVSLQEGFEKMGVPKQFAGRQAALGLQQVAGAITGMSDDMAAFLGEKMGYGEGLEARQGMMEAYTRVAKGNSSEELMGMIGKIASVALEQAGGNKTNAGFALEKMMGVGVAGAKSMLMIKDALDKGDFKQAKKTTEENMRLFKNAFETEGKKQSVFQKHLNKTLQGVSDMGQGLMALGFDVAAYLILSFKTMTLMFSSIFSNESSEVKAQKRQAVQALLGTINTMKEHGKKIGKGFDKWAEGMKGIGGELIGESLKGLKAAWNLDMGGGGGSSLSPATQASQPMIRTVPVIVESGGGSQKGRKDYGLSSGKGDTFGEVDQSNWVGGGISLESTGVTQDGDIILNLRGNCPRCGLLFGENYSDYVDQANLAQGQDPEQHKKDEEDLAYMLQSETGGKGITAGGEHELEAQAIAWTALNRLQDQNSNYGKTLSDVITGGQGHGKQGEKGRAYSTARKPGEEARKTAHEFLSGEHRMADPTQGATYFYHARPGAKFQGDTSSKPGFAEDSGKENTLNVDVGDKKQARFYSSRAGATAAKDESEHDKYYEEKSGAKKAYVPSSPGNGF
jgi:uncharacterized C2H2 Zn-finger protein